MKNLPQLVRHSFSEGGRHRENNPQITQICADSFEKGIWWGERTREPEGRARCPYRAVFVCGGGQGTARPTHNNP